MRIAGVAVATIAALACSLVTAQASVDQIHVQPPTYNAAAHSVTVVVNIPRGSEGYGDLWGPVGVRAEHLEVNGGKITLTASCTPDSGGTLYAWQGTGCLGDDSDCDQVNGAVRSFPCY